MTAKVISAVETGKDQHGNTYYNIDLDNGDRINIGKKEMPQPGTTLDYEIRLPKSDYNGNGYFRAKPAQKEFKGGYKSEPFEHSAARTAMAAAANIVAEGKAETHQLFPLADKIYAWMLNHKQ